jgi:pimeloyl-ACP methyl ester carboxylesterase
MGLIHVHTVPHAQSGPPALQVVLMPGAYHTPNQYLDAGFAQSVRQLAMRVELTLAVPEMAHLTDRRWLHALHEELILPARARNIPLWLGGVSLGGFMALRFAAQYPTVLDGLCLLAPYLGSRIVAREVEENAGRADWRVEPVDEEDDERRIWRYIATRARGATRIFLGYGQNDRFADTQHVLARVLTGAQDGIHVIPGGHDWPVWRALWQQFLQSHGAP